MPKIDWDKPVHVRLHKHPVTILAKEGENLIVQWKYDDLGSIHTGWANADGDLLGTLIEGIYRKSSVYNYFENVPEAKKDHILVLESKELGVFFIENFPGGQLISKEKAERVAHWNKEWKRDIPHIVKVK